MAGDVTASSTTDGQAGTPTDTHGAQPASDAASTRAQAEATNDPWSTWGAAEEPQSWDEWGHQRWGDQGYDGSHGGSWGLPATTRPMTAGDRPLHGGAPSRGAPMRGMGGSTPMSRQRGLLATGLERLRGTIPPGGNEMPGMTAGWEIEIGATTTDAIEAKTTALPGRGHRALRDDPRLRHRRSRAGRLQRKDRVGAAAPPRS